MHTFESKKAIPPPHLKSVQKWNKYTLYRLVKKANFYNFCILSIGKKEENEHFFNFCTLFEGGGDAKDVFLGITQISPIPPSIKICFIEKKLLMLKYGYKYCIPFPASLLS